jgi:hypothetical protein
MVDGDCRACGKYEEYDTIKKRFWCRNGYVYANGRCVKQCNEFEDSFDDDCVCKSHCFLSNQKCTPCGPNSKPHTDRSRCICLDGFVLDSYGKCVPALPVYDRCPDGM